jgi:hypothetical protein
MIFLLVLLIFILLITCSVALIRSENRTERILGKVVIGIILAPIVILILLYLTCLVLINVG